MGGIVRPNPEFLRCGFIRKGPENLESGVRLWEQFSAQRPSNDPESRQHNRDGDDCDG